MTQFNIPFNPITQTDSNQAIVGTGYCNTIDITPLFPYFQSSAVVEQSFPFQVRPIKNGFIVKVGYGADCEAGEYSFNSALGVAEFIKKCLEKSKK